MPITRRKRANPPDQPENNNHNAVQTENAVEALVSAQAPTGPVEGDNAGIPTPEQAATPTIPPPAAPVVPPAAASNGAEQTQQHTVPIESGRRTARGELFRRPPQPPPTVQPPVVTPQAAVATPLQPPTHEISLPLGNLLHLAYNPGYTGSDEARSTLLHKLEAESKAGGRARCWNCGAIAIVYDRWSTRSKTFGEVGVAFCEICGVWSVL
jgi:hypothetical protein